MNLRTIEPINISDLDTAAPDTGEPICERVDPRSLFVDPAYQRSVGERGLRQIRRIVEAFDWTKYKPPICAYAEHDGRTVLKVLDGQHTAIAAASHPDIDMIPVMIVEAAEISAQAAAFVGQNTQRVAVTPLQVFFAEVTAGDVDALDVLKTCERAGVTIMRSPPSRSDFKPAETISISAIKALVDKRGIMRARMILEVLAQAKLAPIAADHIKAAEFLMSEPEYCDQFEPEDLTREIQMSGKAAEHEAKVFSVAQKVPVWRALAVQWFRKTRKKRRQAA
ncbi:DUF6551 family protein [Aquamicrobium zhengzhouense]|uniref:ParB-like nuclease domain-containing protein n=1 Tax=Aquamicrobium zhengzhouense TaxID=2781738 RepID=A0ABS0SE08_9HYPH|nr:DUF6551 family protein [Aquamicrobium zhengzhouense]MBI1621481.1 hypothetical protein [Aquamicrobium zhengzhouense]